MAVSITSESPSSAYSSRGFDLLRGLDDPDGVWKNFLWRDHTNTCTPIQVG